MAHIDVDLAVIGAGPAGLSAAITATKHGLEVAVIDEQHQIGGQIFRRPPDGSGPQHSPTPYSPPAGYHWGNRLLATARTAPIMWFLGYSALAVTSGEGHALVETSATGTTRTIRAKRVILASGAMDQPVPLPGWTLPGVMTAGGAQTLLKAQHLLLNRKVVLVGGHPLILLVADQLRRAGAHVEVAMAPISVSPRALARALRSLPWRLPLLTSSAAAMVRSVLNGVRIHRNTVPTRIVGTSHVTAVTLTPVDSNWQPRGEGRTIETGAVVMGFGFQPATELARQAGCQMLWNSLAGGWVVARDSRGHTNVEAILVAGEPAGVGGADLARAQGLQAGLGAVEDIRGRAVIRAREARRIDRLASRASLFAQAVQEMFAPDLRALVGLATDDTLICRCESVLRGTINRALADAPGPIDINALKRQCRVGMGMCQGRNCELPAGELICQHYDAPAGEAGFFSGQFPAKPVPLSDLADPEVS